MTDFSPTPLVEGVHDSSGERCLSNDLTSEPVRLETDKITSPVIVGETGKVHCNASLHCLVQTRLCVGQNTTANIPFGVPPGESDSSQPTTETHRNSPVSTRLPSMIAPYDFSPRPTDPQLKSLTSPSNYHFPQFRSTTAQSPSSFRKGDTSQVSHLQTAKYLRILQQTPCFRPNAKKTFGLDTSGSRALPIENFGAGALRSKVLAPNSASPRCLTEEPFGTSGRDRQEGRTDDARFIHYAPNLTIPKATATPPPPKRDQLHRKARSDVNKWPEALEGSIVARLKGDSRYKGRYPRPNDFKNSRGLYSCLYCGKEWVRIKSLSSHLTKRH